MTDLTAFPWRTGRTLGRTVYARTGGDDWKADTVIGMLDTPELAAGACAAHNDMLRLHWLIGAGHDVQMGVHDHQGGPENYVWLLGDGTADLASFWACGTLGEGLAMAVDWSRREGMTP